MLKNICGTNVAQLKNSFNVFWNAAMPFPCNGTLLFQGNLPRVLPMIIYKYASCLIPNIDSFLFLFGEWSSLVFKDFQKYFLKPNVFFLVLQMFCRLFIIVIYYL